MKQRSLLLVSILLLASILLSACGGAAQTEEPAAPQPGGLWIYLPLQGAP